MIIYDNGNISFIFKWEGSTIPSAFIYALPSIGFAVGFHYLIEQYREEHLAFVGDTNHSMVWSAFVIVLGTLLGIRTNKAYSRFWEGITLVQQMRAEWFEATSNLMAFSMVACKKDPSMLDAVHQFQFVLIRLMSLMHGAALRQIGGYKEEFDVLDIQAFDHESMKYLAACDFFDLNRVEVLLHWIQVLVTDAASNDVIVVAAPILTRAYQTLSRGMVNLHNARKLADVPFPFPLSQMIIVLLLIGSVLIPFLSATIVKDPVGAAVVSFVPIFGMWGITFVANELEQPFGTDPNDLPLSMLQYDFNTTLLMLMDKECTRAPSLIREKTMSIKSLRACLTDGNYHDPRNTTRGPMHMAEEWEFMKESGKKFSKAEGEEIGTGSVSFVVKKQSDGLFCTTGSHHTCLNKVKEKLRDMTDSMTDSVPNYNLWSTEKIVSSHDLEAERRTQRYSVGGKSDGEASFSLQHNGYPPRSTSNSLRSINEATERRYSLEDSVESEESDVVGSLPVSGHHRSQSSSLQSINEVQDIGRGKALRTDKSCKQPESPSIEQLTAKLSDDHLSALLAVSIETTRILTQALRLNVPRGDGVSTHPASRRCAANSPRIPHMTSPIDTPRALSWDGDNSANVSILVKSCKSDPTKSASGEDNPPVVRTSRSVPPRMVSWEMDSHGVSILRSR